MRMKRKKNLDERIAASSDYLITMKNDSLDFQDAIKENHLLDFNKIFKKEQPVYLHIKIPTKTFFALKETGTC